jgi:hypothetical protein
MGYLHDQGEDGLRIAIFLDLVQRRLSAQSFNRAVQPTEASVYVVVE